MKTWQFIILLMAIFLQPIIIYFWFGYWSQHIAFSQVQRDQVIELEKKLDIIIDNE
jgi:hypothetical protein